MGYDSNGYDTEWCSGNYPPGTREDVWGRELQRCPCGRAAHYHTTKCQFCAQERYAAERSELRAAFAESGITAETPPKSGEMYSAIFCYNALDSYVGGSAQLERRLAERYYQRTGRAPEKYALGVRVSLAPSSPLGGGVAF